MAWTRAAWRIIPNWHFSKDTFKPLNDGTPNLGNLLVPHLTSGYNQEMQEVVSPIHYWWTWTLWDVARGTRRIVLWKYFLIGYFGRYRYLICINFKLKTKDVRVFLKVFVVGIWEFFSSAWASVNSFLWPTVFFSNIFFVYFILFRKIDLRFLTHKEIKCCCTKKKLLQGKWYHLIEHKFESPLDQHINLVLKFSRAPGQRRKAGLFKSLSFALRLLNRLIIY